MGRHWVGSNVHPGKTVSEEGSGSQNGMSMYSQARQRVGRGTLGQGTESMKKPLWLKRREAWDSAVLGRCAA